MLRNARAVMLPFVRILAGIALAAATLWQPAVAADAMLGVGAPAPAVTEPTAQGTFDSMTQADVDLFAKRFDIVYRIGFDGHDAAANAYGLTSYPTIYLVNAARHEVAVETGEVSFEELHADVTAALAHQ